MQEWRKKVFGKPFKPNSEALNFSRKKQLKFFTQIYHDEKKAKKELTDIWRLGETITQALEEKREYTLTKSVLFDFEGFKPEQTKKFQTFLEVLKKDKDLKAFVESEFERTEKQYKTYLENIQSWKQTWNNLPKMGKVSRR